jgi:glycosyltransferase involved in cell wall biosynthesis
MLTPVINEAASLAEVLERFRGQEDPGGEIESILVDAASTDDTKVAETLPAVLRRGDAR